LVSRPDRIALYFADIIMRRTVFALLTFAAALAMAVAVVATQAPSRDTGPGRAVLVLGEHVKEPFAVAFDRAGRTYIAEMGGHRVSVLQPNGAVSVLAGTGEAGLAGDGGPAAKAQLNSPHHLVIGPDEHLYIADTFNNVVRRIDLRTGIITRVAGKGGPKAYSGDGGPAIAAEFGGVFAIAFHDRALYICDLDSHRIRVVDPKTGIVTTVAGNGEKGVPKDGEDARTQPLVDPRAVAIDSKGLIYILERNGHALRVVDRAGKIRTVAGTGEAGFSGDGGPALSAQMRGPKHISIDDDDSVLITDTENHVIRRYSPKDGTIARVMGTGTMGAAGVDGPALQCELNRPHGAQVHPRTHALFISDSENHRVLRIDRR
jgi:streptogramin lyase